MGDKPPDWLNPGVFHHSVARQMEDATTDHSIEKIGVYTIGGENISVRTGGYGDILPPPQKHYSPIYHN